MAHIWPPLADVGSTVHRVPHSSPLLGRVGILTLLLSLRSAWGCDSLATRPFRGVTHVNSGDIPTPLGTLY